MTRRATSGSRRSSFPPNAPLKSAALNARVPSNLTTPEWDPDPELLEKHTLRELGGTDHWAHSIGTFFGWFPWFYVFFTLWRIERLLTQHGAGNEAQVRTIYLSDWCWIFRSQDRAFRGNTLLFERTRDHAICWRSISNSWSDLQSPSLW